LSRRKGQATMSNFPTPPADGEKVTVKDARTVEARERRVDGGATPAPRAGEEG
jgi:hypothetical protein